MNVSLSLSLSLLSLLLWLTLYPPSLLPSFTSFFLSYFEAGTHRDEDGIMDSVTKASLEREIILLLFSEFMHSRAQLWVFNYPWYSHLKKTWSLGGLGFSAAQWLGQAATRSLCRTVGGSSGREKPQQHSGQARWLRKASPAWWATVIVVASWNHLTTEALVSNLPAHGRAIIGTVAMPAPGKVTIWVLGP